MEAIVNNLRNIFLMSSKRQVVWMLILFVFASHICGQRSITLEDIKDQNLRKQLKQRIIELDKKILGDKLDIGEILEKYSQLRIPLSAAIPSDQLYILGSQLFRIANRQKKGFLTAIYPLPQPNTLVCLLSACLPTLESNGVFFPTKSNSYHLLFCQINPQTKKITIKSIVAIPEFTDKQARDAIFLKVEKIIPYSKDNYFVSVTAWATTGFELPSLNNDSINYLGVEGKYIAMLTRDYSLKGQIYFENIHRIIQEDIRGKHQTIWPQEQVSTKRNDYYDLDRDGSTEKLIVSLDSRGKISESQSYQISILQWKNEKFHLVDPAKNNWQTSPLFIEFNKNKQSTYRLRKLLEKLSNYSNNMINSLEQKKNLRLKK